MNITNPNFQKINQLSQEGKSFFFVIDFLKENVLIFDKNQLDNQEILVEFPKYKNVTRKIASRSILDFEIERIAYEDYKIGFEKIQNAIKKGESYLCNYTCKSLIKTQNSLDDFFWNSKAKYKVLLPDKWLFFSPETFIKINENFVITEPMKGTIDANTPNAKEILMNDVKENAEHFTVVDLLRNDLSMISDNVDLKKFKRLDYLQTSKKNLYAMSSVIEGKVKAEFEKNIGDLLDTILPAGSVLGAPKHQTLKIIQNAETYKRGFYTGISGYFDGENLDTCVMIRFLENENNHLFFKSGGGITHQSICEKEYNEMLNKIYVPIN